MCQTSSTVGVAKVPSSPMATLEQDSVACESSDTTPANSEVHTWDGKTQTSFKKTCLSITEFRKASLLERVKIHKSLKCGFMTRKPEVEILIKENMFIERRVARKKNGDEILFSVPLDKVDMQINLSHVKSGFRFSVRNVSSVEQRVYQVNKKEDLFQILFHLAHLHDIAQGMANNADNDKSDMRDIADKEDESSVENVVRSDHRNESDVSTINEVQHSPESTFKPDAKLFAEPSSILTESIVQESVTAGRVLNRKRNWIEGSYIIPNSLGLNLEPSDLDLLDETPQPEIGFESSRMSRHFPNPYLDLLKLLANHTGSNLTLRASELHKPATLLIGSNLLLHKFHRPSL